MEPIRKIISQVLISEHTKADIRSQVEIIYKDPNIICMIPKTQAVSNIYGHGTFWCQTEMSGFQSWARQGLLIRFITKAGRKFRFTYFFEESGKFHSADYYWSNEKGQHILEGDGNPFEVRPPKDRIRDVEKDVLDLIATVPQECRDKVLKFIAAHRKSYDYCLNYDKGDYQPERTKRAREEYSEFYKQVDKELGELYHDYRILLGISFKKQSGNYEIVHRPADAPYHEQSKEETFKHFEPFKKRVLELIQHYKSTVPRQVAE